MKISSYFKFLLGFTFILAGSACGSEAADPLDADPGPSCAAGDVGDLSATPTLTLQNQGPDGVSLPLSSGGQLALMAPPQGGRVSFIGLRVTNMSACGVKVSSRIRNVVSDQIQQDARTVDLIDLGDGWAGSVDGQISTFSHLPMCPNEWSSDDVEGTEYELSVTVTDQAGREATSTVRVVPECAESDKVESCKCLCGADYTPGTLCGN